MKQLNFKVAYPSQPFTQDDSFADTHVKMAYASDNKTRNGGIIDTFLQTAKSTKDMIVEESKVIAPDVVDTFKESRTRLNKERRIIKAIPNSILYYSIVAIGVLVIVRNV